MRALSRQNLPSERNCVSPEESLTPSLSVTAKPQRAQAPGCYLSVLTIWRAGFDYFSNGVCACVGLGTVGRPLDAGEMLNLSPAPRSTGMIAASGPWSLSRQFALVGSMIMVVAMIFAGFVTTRLVARAALENTASSTALLLASFLGPLAQELATEPVLSQQKAAQLDELLAAENLKSRYPHLEIWKEGGRIAYSTSPGLTGLQFTPPVGLVAALEGDVSANYADLDAHEHALRAFHTSFLEIYVPIREHLSGKVIAVAEIHEAREALDDELSQLRTKTWLVIAAATSLIMLSLFWIVYRGSKTIELQQRELRLRMTEIAKVSEHVKVLKDRAQRASIRVAEMTETLLRRIGADLHDGPAQLVALAALKVEHARRAATAATREIELQGLDATLADALRELRTVSKGLMLPEIEHLNLTQVLEKVVRIHEQRTGTEVTLDCPDIAQPFPHAVKLCAYRFVQEGLNNAFRHAGGTDQVVTAQFENAILTLAVEDGGGPRLGEREISDNGMGLIGLSERVESLGGIFKVEHTHEGGTRIEMTLNIAGVQENG